VQEKTAFLPDYSFKKPAAPRQEGVRPPGEPKRDAAKSQGEQKKDEGSRLATSISGLIGALLTLALAFVSGYFLKRRHRLAR
jgi:cobalt/nickel transport system permease protein